MNTVIPSLPPSAPHLLGTRLSPSSSDAFNTSNMSGRKRKASEEAPDNDRMSTSPTASPSISHRNLPPRSIKRTRTDVNNGRPLMLPRLLQTLSAEQMRTLLKDVCDTHPELQQEVVTRAPPPSIESTLAVLSKYEEDFRGAFPLGNRPTSDYAYNRVRQHLLQLIEALRDFTPQFLPPREAQTAVSLAYLDAVTTMIHRLPDWDTFSHQRHKSEAYDELAQAWALVVQEAAKRGGGFLLQFHGWDRKLMEHNAKSGGKLEEAVAALRANFGFMQAGAGMVSASGAGSSLMADRESIRNQLMNGTYGHQQLGVGPDPRW